MDDSFPVSVSLFVKRVTISLLHRFVIVNVTCTYKVFSRMLGKAQKAWPLSITVISMTPRNLVRICDTNGAITEWKAVEEGSG